MFAPMPKLFPVGMSDFRASREQRMEHVDKSVVVRDLLDTGAPVVMLPRPRRFGKTSALSMLRCFFERRPEDLSELFRDLAIIRSGARYWKHFQSYPVVYLGFKDVRAARWEDAFAAIRGVLAGAFGEHRGLLATGALDERETRSFRAMLAETADPALYETALLDLTRALYKVHGQKAVVLIDDYDEPLLSAYVGGYLPQATSFLRNFLGTGLKDNHNIFKAVLTGVLRLTGVSLFSSLSNIDIYTVFDKRFSAGFGFTEEEMKGLLESAGKLPDLDVLRATYGGYRAGEELLYNPWSVLNYLNRPGEPAKGYWVAANSHDWARVTLAHRASELQAEIHALVEGHSIELYVNPDLAPGDWDGDLDALLGLLVMCGYLTAHPAPSGAEGMYRLSIPNREVKAVFASALRDVGRRAGR